MGIYWDSTLDLFLLCMHATCCLLVERLHLIKCIGLTLLQAINISDPYLIAEILQSKDFDKETFTYRQLDSVRFLLMWYLFHLAEFMPSVCTRFVGIAVPTDVFHLVVVIPAMQMFGDKGHKSILTGQTSSQSWRLVRKGVMPAFSPNNIRQLPSLHQSWKGRPCE